MRNAAAGQWLARRRSRSSRTTPNDFEGTIKKGVDLGASSIELWQDYKGFPLVPDADLRR